MVRQTLFVIGGCRSGKSRQALELAEKLAVDDKIFVATCVPQDEEMRQRVTQHQKERGNLWNAVEAPIEVPATVMAHSAPDNVVLVDCLTLWTSNLLMTATDGDLDVIRQAVTDLSVSLEKAPGPVILVSNEVGTGVVPENKLARLFRDATGYVNQQIAAIATSVFWMVAGIPVKIK
jgi:adenosylcobinamide kinase/adenosylcobinamide-phosphate guanylyltransferase